MFVILEDLNKCIQNDKRMADTTFNSNNDKFVDIVKKISIFTDKADEKMVNAYEIRMLIIATKTQIAEILAIKNVAATIDYHGIKRTIHRQWVPEHFYDAFRPYEVTWNEIYKILDEVNKKLRDLTARCAAEFPNDNEEYRNCVDL